MAPMNGELFFFFPFLSVADLPEARIVSVLDLARLPPDPAGVSGCFGSAASVGVLFFTIRQVHDG